MGPSPVSECLFQTFFYYIHHFSLQDEGFKKTTTLYLVFELLFSVHFLLHIMRSSDSDDEKEK